MKHKNKCFTHDSATISVKFVNAKTKTAYKKVIKLAVTVEANKAEFSVAETALDLLVKDTKALTVTGDATFKSADEKIATVDEKGVVTAVAAGKTTITVTSKEDATKTASVTISVKTAALESVSQTEPAKFALIFKGDTKSVKREEIKITNDKGTVFAVKTIAVDSKDATKINLETFVALNDGKTYTFSYDGTDIPVVVTDGVVASISLNKTVIPYATLTEMIAITKDANGVKLGEAKLDAAANGIILSAKTMPANAYTKGTGLYLDKINDTAVLKAEYHTNKYVDGKEQGAITEEITVTAGAQSGISKVEVKVDSAANKKFADLKDNKIKGTGETAYAYIKITDDTDTEISNYGDYKVVAADDDVLAVADPTADLSKNGTNAGSTGVAIVGLKEGTGYLLLKKGDAIIDSIEVVVAPNEKLASATLTVDTFSLSTSDPTTVTTKIKAKDQYGNDYPISRVVVRDTTKLVSPSLGAGKTELKHTEATATEDVTFEVEATTQVGSYTYILDLADTSASTTTVTTLQANIKVGEPAGVTYSYAFDLSAGKEISVKTDANNKKTGDSFTIKIKESRGGYATGASVVSDGAFQVNGTSTVSAINIKITAPDGKTISTSRFSEDYATGTVTVQTISQGGVNVISDGAINSSVDDVITKLAAGEYKVEGTITYETGDVAPKATHKTITLTPVTFKITDGTAFGSGELKATSGNLAAIYEYKDAAGNVLTPVGYDYTLIDSTNKIVSLKTLRFIETVEGLDIVHDVTNINKTVTMNDFNEDNKITDLR